MIRTRGVGFFLRQAILTLIRPFQVLHSDGIRVFTARAFAKATSKLQRFRPVMLVKLEDAAAVDWTQPGPQLSERIVVEEGPIDIAWIMSPPGPESGGHQNLFRFIKFAEDAGHRNTIHLYSARTENVSVSEVRGMLRMSEAYPDIKAEIRNYDPAKGVGRSAQALFASGWETAYPAFLDRSAARRFYFVQDFEPSFYPMGSEYILAENTYRFGFHGITAGGWLAAKLHAEYGMATDHFDFAVDKRFYSVTNRNRRDEVFFYARPVTARRAFEFGLIALADFARLRPDVTINMAGWDVSNWEIPFRYRNLASLQLTELNEVYNRCAAGLVMSLSNMSLLPLELISAGVTPVVNDGPNNRMVSDNPFIEYVPLSPAAIARKLVEVLERPDGPERSVAMSESVMNTDWNHSGAQFLTAFEGAMRA